MVVAVVVRVPLLLSQNAPQMSQNAKLPHHHHHHHYYYHYYYYYYYRWLQGVV